jgi:hypothetical protein
MELGGGGQAGEAGANSAGALPSAGGAAAAAGDTISMPGGSGGAALTVYVSALPAFLCTGADLDMALAVTGGRDPYTWMLVDAPEGLDLSSNGAQATLTGTFDAPGTYPVTVVVTDESGQREQQELAIDVRPTPSVSVESIPSICPNEIYSVPLESEGGDPRYEVWSTDLSEATGIALVGNRLAGRFESMGSPPGGIDFSVSVENAGCSSAPVTLTLEPAAADECPLILPLNGWPELPEPCLGMDYSAGLFADGGAQGYVWEAVSLPDGLTFDGDTATISGVASVGGTVAVQVEDGAGRVVARDFALSPRDKCWLAYLRGDPSATKLELFDPVLSRREALPREASAEPVMDFEFSPNGRWLAYRTGTDPSAGRLALLDLATLGDAPLDFDAVTLYAWEADSASLLIAFDTAEGRFLGGIIPSGTTTSPSYSKLTPGEAHVDSPPIAYGDSAVGFLSADGPFQKLAIAARTELGFENAELRIDSGFELGDWLHPAPAGLFGMPSNDFEILYYGADGFQFAFHDNVRVAPSGRYVARQQEGALALFLPAQDSSPPDATPHLTSAGCEQLIGWAEQRERVACTRSAQSLETGTRVAFFNIDPEADTVSNAVALRGEYSYPEITPSVRHRLFSPSGNRFAFTTDVWLFAARITTDDAVVDFRHQFNPAPGLDDAELAFSPDETRLLEHRGTRLSLFEFDDELETEWLLSDSLPASRACTDAFKAASGYYCGEGRGTPAFDWSSTSDLVAYRTSDGHVRVFDLRFIDQGDWRGIDVASDCAGECRAGTEFAFQP